jgi:hypothetical protein
VHRDNPYDLTTTKSTFKVRRARDGTLQVQLAIVLHVGVAPEFDSALQRPTTCLGWWSTLRCVDPIHSTDAAT